MTTSELALLALISELDAPSGYGVVAVARARGMARWAGLSTSSIYKGLHRLVTRGLVSARPSAKKTGKGPPGRVHVITTVGTKTLHHQLVRGLRTAPEQSARFRLSLAFVDAIGANLAVKQLELRARDLTKRTADVERARARDAAPLGAALIFEYVLHALEQERVVTSRLVALVKARSRRR